VVDIALEFKRSTTSCGVCRDRNAKLVVANWTRNELESEGEENGLREEWKEAEKPQQAGRDRWSGTRGVVAMRGEMR